MFFFLLRIAFKQSFQHGIAEKIATINLAIFTTTQKHLLHKKIEASVRNNYTNLYSINKTQAFNVFRVYFTSIYELEICSCHRLVFRFWNL
jgi:hypothetical protein